jgi:hypothetical protein
MSKEIKQLVKELALNGYTVDQGRTHYRIRGKNGEGIVGSLPLSPGRGPWEKNLRSELRKRGLLPDTRMKA